MKLILLQITSTDDPVANLAVVQDMIAQAAANGADMILTPEVTNCLSADRAHQSEILQLEENDPTLKALQIQAATLNTNILIGSLALQTGDADGRFANRSILIARDGSIVARYDKIHMFDVDVSAEETYRESSAYRAGTTAVLAKIPEATFGLTVCYDLRFPQLYRHLAQAGAQIITVPAAFSYVTGPAHWESLLRARAIETGCFIVAPAQTGDHGCRKTHGHSLVIDPWGTVLADAGTEVGATYVDIDLAKVDQMRHKVPSLFNETRYILPA
ncbi:carbon-nitrogen hydrolase family protein [Algirhabdus cladophorae]|uniref:carbon-nitrogen hydrolase family protein n=1 Tax=Algirhabdus cladophorae TaxID=3377108 RepID=UPI003B8451B6